MSRLTTKCDSDEYIVGVTTNGGYDEDVVLEKQYEVNNKLGRLEDLEEEIGCPLEILFRALSDGIYRYNYEIKLTFEKVLYIGKDDNNVYYINWLGSWNERIKNYKKTWWLKEDKSE